MRPILARVFSSTVWLFAGWVGFTCVMYGEEANTNAMKAIEGSVGYRERMALPPNAEIHVFLEDVARMDVPSQVIPSTSLAPEGGPPWAFSLEYDPRKLHDRGRYVLSARIEADGPLLFISTEQIPAFSRDAGSPSKSSSHVSEALRQVARSRRQRRMSV